MQLIYPLHTYKLSVQWPIESLWLRAQNAINKFYVFICVRCEHYFFAFRFFFVLPLTNCWSLISHQKARRQWLIQLSIYKLFIQQQLGHLVWLRLSFVQSLFFLSLLKISRKSRRTKRKRERNSKEHERKSSPLEHFSCFHLNSKTIDDQEVNRDMI